MNFAKTATMNSVPQVVALLRCSLVRVDKTPEFGALLAVWVACSLPYAEPDAVWCSAISTAAAFDYFFPKLLPATTMLSVLLAVYVGDTTVNASHIGALIISVASGINTLRQLW